MTSSELIQQLRALRGMSQGKLAYLLETQRQRISEYERGTVVPSGDRLLQMIEILGGEVRVKE